MALGPLNPRSASNIREFRRKLNEAKKRVEHVWTEATRDVAVDIADLTAKRTPRDTGRLEASWDLDRSVHPEVKPKGQYAPPGREKFESQMSMLKRATFVSLSNEQPYAAVAEFGLWAGINRKKTTGRGFSTQAPEGMLGISVLDVVKDLRTRKVKVPRDGWKEGRWGGT